MLNQLPEVQRKKVFWFKPIVLYTLLLLLGILPLLPVLFSRSPILNNDMLLAYFSYFWDYHKNWSWTQPLVFWSSSYQCGMPMHAYWQSAFLYPLTWILFGPMSPHYGIYFFYSLHFSLGIFGFLKLGPHLRLHKPAALWAGICFSLSGTMLARYEHVTFLSGWAFMPLVLATYLSLRKDPRLKNLFIYSTTVALQAIGGHPQASVTTGIFIAFYTLAHFWKISRVPFNSKFSVFASLKNSKIRWIIGGHLLALLYCTPMLVPFLHLVSETSRFDGTGFEEGIMQTETSTEKLAEGVFNFEKFSTGALRPIHLLSLVAPHILGSPSNGSWWGGEAWGEVFIYLGALGFFFAFYGSWKRANWNLRLLYIVGLFGLWLAFGKHLGASQILYDIPGFNNFRRPGRYVILFVFGMAALSGHGFQNWLGKPRGQKVVLVMGAAAFLLMVILIGFYFSTSFQTHLLSLLNQLKHLDPHKNYGLKISLLIYNGIFDTLILALSASLIWLCARRPKKYLGFLFVILIADLVRLHWDHFYLFPAEYYRTPPVTQPLLDQKTSPYWRVSHFLEYPGLEMWQMHNDPLSHLNLFEREKNSFSFGIHSIFGVKHVSAHLPLMWNWNQNQTAGELSSRYFFSNVPSLKFYKGDSLNFIQESRDIYAYEIKSWQARIQYSSGSRVPQPLCDSSYHPFGGLCAYEKKDGHFLIRGNFQINDTIIIRERAYSGWRYRFEKGPWKNISDSKDHYLIIPLPEKVETIEIEFFPKEFYFYLAICVLVTGLLSLIFFLKKPISE